MFFRILLAGLLAAISFCPALFGQTGANPVVGWYNGDWQSGIPTLANWYVSDTQVARIYDDFMVPSAGWTVTGVFSNNALNGTPVVSQASWEIRSGVSAGNGGTVVAWGVDPAKVIRNSNGSSRIEVAGLQVSLPGGRYWLNVAP